MDLIKESLKHLSLIKGQENNDILPQLKLLAENELNDNEVLLAPGFTMYDAIPAIEIMDPKLDSGLALQAESQLNVAHGNICSTLSFESLIDMMDDMTHQEEYWLNGSCLSVSIYSCAHVFHQESCHPFLRVYTGALWECVRLALDIVVSAGIYVRGEFSTQPYGPIESYLYQYEKDWVKELENLEACLTFEMRHQMNAPLYIALISRLRYRKQWLHILQIMSQEPISLSRLKENLNRLLKQSTLISGKTCTFSWGPAERRAMGCSAPLPSLHYCNPMARTSLCQRAQKNGFIESTQRLEDLLQFCVSFMGCRDLSSLLSTLRVYTFEKHHLAILTRSCLLKCILQESLLLGIYLPADFMLSGLSKLDMHKIDSESLHFQCLQWNLDIVKLRCCHFSKLAKLIPKLIANIAYFQEDLQSFSTVRLSPLSQNAYHCWAHYQKLVLLTDAIKSGLLLEIYSNYELLYVFSLLYWLTDTLTVESLETERFFYSHIVHIIQKDLAAFSKTSIFYPCFDLNVDDFIRDRFGYILMFQNTFPSIEHFVQHKPISIATRQPVEDDQTTSLSSYYQGILHAQEPLKVIDLTIQENVYCLPLFKFHNK